MQAHQPHYFVYIFSDQPREKVEIGVSGDLQELSHTMALPTESSLPSQPARLVYYEHYRQEEEARSREQQLKKGNHDATIRLVESMNPNWLDLSDTLVD
ncbi:GIY-YIG nuclease family protein [Pontibacter mangrovi]|uniref:Excinuclease ABC subunit C n=1 Tax=Pontibacter mangrovi TaxID=2589816 RepID=A0A501WF48_9BACT|nr:excinuclease ABC subunit C [Pontibacter mangrovi]TPE45811.1 excinuclease ABC subunit C [Pontibacter mangrovi]